MIECGMYRYKKYLECGLVLVLLAVMLPGKSEILREADHSSENPARIKEVNRVGFTIDPISNISVSENTIYTEITPAVTGTVTGTLKYTLSGPDAFDFTIDPSSGILSMIARDFESPSDSNADNVYEVTIKATDSANESDTEELTVTVLDAIEAAVFTIAPIPNSTITENSVFTGTIPVVTGTSIGGSLPQNFTVVPVPDTQYYTGQVNGGTNLTFKAQSNWIVANKNALNIKYLVHLGDCVQNGDNGGNDVEWGRADESISIFEDPITTQLPHGIPYGLNVGNHDQSPDGNASGTTNFFNQFFGFSRFAGRDYYGGHYGTNNDNNFQLFTAGGMDFIAINLEYDPLANPLVLDWADNLLKTHSTRRAIISSHFIINPDGSFGDQGQAIYNKLKVNSNLFLMLCGHRNPNGEASRSDTYNGNTITTLLSDFQDRTNGGNGWMRYMEFMPSENKVYVSTYSPTLDLYETDANSKFAFNYNMTSGINPGSLVYSLGGPDASRFTITPSTGLINMSGRNYEVPDDANSDNIYEVNVIATDADGNTSSEALTVTVTNVSETATFNISPVENATINEGLVFTSNPPIISGTPNGNLTYSLSGTDVSLFTINPSTGVVTLAAKNFEVPADSNADNVYELTIAATDGDNNTGTGILKVKVINVNEVATFSINTIANTTINEGLGYTGATPVISGTPNGTLTYSLSGPDASHFTIDPASGIVGMTARNFEVPADSDMDNIYGVIITATDGDNNTAAKAWNVTVTNINETATFNISPVENATINEGLAFSSSPPVISGTPNGNLTYSLSGTDVSLFTINPSTGVVNLAAKNFEVPEDFNTDNVYEVSIIATDGDGNTARRDWTVRVINVAELAIFNIIPVEESIKEGMIYTGSNPTVTGNHNGALAYSLSGNDASHFIINSATGILSMQAKDFEIPVDLNADNIYELSIVAKDGDNNMAVGIRRVTITNVNEIAIYSLNPIENITIMEGLNYTGGTPIINGTPHGKLTFSLSGTDASNFTVNSTTGVVSMVAKNYEHPTDANADNVYQLTIIATDQDGNAYNRGWAVTIVQGIADGSLSVLAPSVLEIVADGTSKQTLTVRAKDAQGDFQTKGGAAVIIKKITGDGSISTVIDQNNGTYTATLTSPTSVGEAVLTATVNGQDVKGGGAASMRSAVKYVPGTASLLTSTLSAEPLNIIADGAATSIITLRLKDINGNELKGGAGLVVLNTSAGTIGSVTDNNNGTYTAALVSGTIIANATITARLTNQPISNTVGVHFIPGPISLTASTIFASAPVISHGGELTLSITVQLKDAHGNNIMTGGKMVRIQSTAGILSAVTDNNNGSYTAVLSRGTVTGYASISFTLDSIIASKKTVVLIENNLPLVKKDVVCAAENVPITFLPLSNDADLDGMLDPATLDLSQEAGIQKSFNVSGQGTYTANENGLVTFTPLEGFSGASTPINYTVKDNNDGLSAPAEISVNVNPRTMLTISIISGSKDICAGTSVVFKAIPVKTGNNPVYQWKIDGINTGVNSPEFRPDALLNGQVVSCVMTSEALCGDLLIANSNSVEMIVRTLPADEISVSSPITFFKGGNVKLSAAIGNDYSYQWLKNGEIILGAVASSYTSTESGRYSVRVSTGLCITSSKAVDVNVIFNLPANNFVVSATNETCKTSNNGMIKITALTPMDYTVSIIGNGINTSEKFISSLQVENLSAGTYLACITVNGVPEYKSCFTLVITEPKDLALYSSIRTSDNTLYLKMEGSSLYNIELNGLLYTTSQDQITLPLAKGNNKLRVSTENICQGTIERDINFSSIYPNPFTGKLNIDVGEIYTGISTVEIINYEGKRIYSSKHYVQNGSISLDLQNISKGPYLLKLFLGDSETTYKIEKR